MIVPFTQATIQEQADDLALEMVFDRQRVLGDLEVAIAQMVYLARALFIGGQCLPWGLLTPGQQLGYVMEAKALIQTEGEQ